MLGILLQDAWLEQSSPFILTEDKEHFKIAAYELNLFVLPLDRKFVQKYFLAYFFRLP